MSRELSSEHPERNKDLERRYTAIGISAVAAAARYHEPKNIAYAPADAPKRLEARFEEAAA